MDPWNIIHILGFITPNVLSICVMIMAHLLIFQALIWMGMSTGSVYLLSKRDAWLGYLNFSVNVLQKEEH